MKQIRPNIWEITYAELGSPPDKGPVDVEGVGRVYLDIADMRYVREHLSKGFDPLFFVSRSPAMGNGFVVVSRQRAA
jgi:hypothetical protein